MAENFMGTPGDFDGFSSGAQSLPVSATTGLRGVWLPSAAALLLCLAPTLWISRQQWSQVRAEQAETIERRAERIQSVLLSQLRNCGLLLRTVQSLYLASSEITEAEFQALYANLETRDELPSLKAMAFAEARNFPDGKHYITRAVAPAQGNEALLGLDISTQAPNQRALELSRDTDEVAMSAPFRLIQFDRSGVAAEGVALRLPVYSPGKPPASVEERRRRIVGTLGFSFHAKELVAWALPGDMLSELHVRIEDVAERTPVLLFDSHPDRAVRMRAAEAYAREILYGGRTWRVSVNALGETGTASVWRDTVLIPGLLVGLLAALLVASLANTRRRALDWGWQLSRRYRESEQRFRALNELLPALVVLADADSGQVRYANQAARECLGSQIGALRLADVFEDAMLQASLQVQEPLALQGVEATLRTAGGRRFWASVSVQSVELDGRRKLLMVASDISEQRKLTELLSHQASHDSLTELYNRREFERRFDQLLDTAGEGALGALFYIDLDQFKLINDTSGHIAGDQLLVQLGMRLREMLGPGELLARLGGDEFGVLATTARDRAAAERLGERIRRLIDGYVFVWEKRSYTSTASIGVVMIEPPGSRDDFLAQADTACYIAKESGRNRVHVYSAHDDDATRRESEMEWANRLRWAIERQQFLLKYQEVQPLAAPEEMAAKVEILLRFRGEGGQQPAMPGTFLPAAERYGLMPMIDRWVIGTVIANFDRLHPQGAGLAMATVNLSGASLEDETLADDVLALLERHRLAPERLCFEITETAAVRNLARAARFIERLRAVGCSFALDDFGAGMSSFGYLKNLPIDYIKIDGSFSRDMLEDPMSEAVVRAVADIGHRIGLKVVAEWVDDPRIANALVRLGVDYGQGFALHRPEIVAFQRAQ